jgi:hypothetical protein
MGNVNSGFVPGGTALRAWRDSHIFPETAICQALRRRFLRLIPCWLLQAAKRWQFAMPNWRVSAVTDNPDDLLPHEPDESKYKPVSHVSVGESPENLDFTLSLRTTDGGIFRFRLSPSLTSELMTWIPFVACEQAKRAKIHHNTNEARNLVPVRITQLSGEAGHLPGEALLIADAGQLTLALVVDFDSLRGLQKWIDQMFRFVPPPEGVGMQ